MKVELSEFNFKLFIPLIFPIFKRIGDFTKKSYMIKDHQLFKTFRYFLSYILFFIFLLIIYFRTRAKKEEKNIKQIKDGQETLEKLPTIASRTFSISNTIDELKVKYDKKNKYKSLLFLGLLCLMGLFCYFFRFIFEQDEYKIAKQSIGIFFDIALYIILSYLILKQKLYKHNFISSGIIAFVLLILFIISAFYIEGKAIFHSFIYYFFYSLSFVLYDILKKKYMTLFFNTPYFMMLVIGAVNIILVLIYDTFAYNFNPEISGVIIGLKVNINSVGSFFKFCLDIIVEFIWNLGIWLTIYYLTPCHYFISEYISEYVYYILSAIESNEGFYSTANIVIFSISYFINFLCCLVFNEVIILNFFGLDYNTSKRIKERIKQETLLNEKEAQMIFLDEQSENS